VTEQLALLEVETPAPNLTARQAFALHELENAGTDGLTTDELGALLCQRNGKHDAGTRCRFDGKNGRALLLRLRELELARYRAKAKVWTVTSPIDTSPRPSGMLSDDEAIPF
jgi:hypothetical protein